MILTDGEIFVFVDKVDSFTFIDFSILVLKESNDKESKAFKSSSDRLFLNANKTSLILVMSVV